MKKFSFYVSGSATRLKTFLSKYGNHTLITHKIKFILIDNLDNKELRKICEKQKIKLYEVELSTKENKNEYISNLFLEYLKNYAIDYGFIFANRILVGKLLNEYENKLINFHPSILPSHKGLYAIDQALKENTFLLGNSAHIVTNKLDAGSIIMQNIFPAIKFKNYNDVLDKQLIMILQLIKWLTEERMIICKNKVIIKDALYDVDEFIPNIDIEDYSI